MIIDRIAADGYKNLSGVDIDLDGGINVFCGENAQGKTNLLESVWLCTGVRPFRYTKDRNFVGFDRDKAEIALNFTDSIRSQKINWMTKKENPKEKLVTLNEVRLNSASGLFGKLKCVLFTPNDPELVKGTPEYRRKFLDISAAQIKHSYVGALSKYISVLAQRNALLKSGAGAQADGSQFDVWDEQLALTGAYISALRYTYCNNLNKYASELYNLLTGGSETLSISYNSTIFKENIVNTDYKGDLYEVYRENLKKSFRDDLSAGFTLCGTHRDDISVRINGRYAREFGSQGQARSAALIMKLAAARIMKEETGESPVMLLDDILSELDANRRGFILNSIEGLQTLITCCDEKLISGVLGGKVFKVKSGEVTDAGNG